MGLPDQSALHLIWAGRGRFMLDTTTKRRGWRAVRSTPRDATEALALVPQALRLLASADFDRGRWRTSYAAAAEAVEVGRELGQHSTVCACLGVLADIDAAAGNVESCHAWAADAIEIATERGLGFYRERAERALGRSTWRWEGPNRGSSSWNASTRGSCVQAMSRT